MAHPNADLVRKGLQAIARGDMATVDQIVADDAKWHNGGTSPVSGDFEGKETIIPMFAVMPKGMTSWQPEIHEILATDNEHVVALVKNTVDRGGETLRNDMVFVFHVTGGKMIEAWATPVDHAAFEALWA